MNDRIVVLDDYLVAPKFLLQVFQHMSASTGTGRETEIFLLTGNPFTAKACEKIGYRSHLSSDIPRDIKAIDPHIIIAGNNGGIKQNFTIIRDMNIPTLMVPHGFKWLDALTHTHSTSEWRSELMEYTRVCCSSHTIKERLEALFGIEPERLAVTGALETDNIISSPVYDRHAVLDKLGLHDNPHQIIITLYSTYECDGYPIYSHLSRIAKALDHYCFRHPDKARLIFQAHPYEFELGTRPPQLKSNVIFTGMPGAVNRPGTIPIEPGALARVSDIAFMALSTANFINILAGNNLFIVSSGLAGREKDIHSLYGSCANILEDDSLNPVQVSRLLESRNKNFETEEIPRKLEWYDSFCDGKSCERITMQIRDLIGLKRSGTKFHILDTIAVLEERCVIHPDNNWQRFNLGVAHMYSGQTVKAENIWNRILIRNPRFLPAASALVHRYLDNRLDQARDVLQIALKCHPFHITAPLSYFKRLLALGLFRDARELYKDLKQRLDLYTHLSDIHLDMLEVRLMLEKRKEIPTCLESFFLHYIPSPKNTALILKCLARREEWEPALRMLDTRVGENEWADELFLKELYRFASLLREYRYFPEADRVFRRVIGIIDAIEPEHKKQFEVYRSGAFFHTALIADALAKYDAALDSVNRCLKLNSNHSAATRLKEKILRNSVS